MSQRIGAAGTDVIFSRQSAKNAKSKADAFELIAVRRLGALARGCCQINTDLDRT